MFSCVQLNLKMMFDKKNVKLDSNQSTSAFTTTSGDNLHEILTAGSFKLSFLKLQPLQDTGKNYEFPFGINKVILTSHSQNILCCRGTNWHWDPGCLLCGHLWNSLGKTFRALDTMWDGCCSVWVGLYEKIFDDLRFDTSLVFYLRVLLSQNDFLI